MARHGLERFQGCEFYEQPHEFSKLTLAVKLQMICEGMDCFSCLMAKPKAHAHARLTIFLINMQKSWKQNEGVSATFYLVQHGLLIAHPLNIHSVVCS
jgi:hypothetical protein